MTRICPAYVQEHILHIKRHRKGFDNYLRMVYGAIFIPEKKIDLAYTYVAYSDACGAYYIGKAIQNRVKNNKVIAGFNARLREHFTMIYGKTAKQPDKNDISFGLRSDFRLGI